MSARDIRLLALFTYSLLIFRLIVQEVFPMNKELNYDIITASLLWLQTDIIGLIEYCMTVGTTSLPKTQIIKMEEGLVSSQ